MFDTPDHHQQVLDGIMAENVARAQSLLASGRLTPFQQAAAEVVIELTEKTFCAMHDETRAQLLQKLARTSLLRSDTARRILALPETPPELRTAIVAMLNRRGEPST